MASRINPINPSFLVILAVISCALFFGRYNIARAEVKEIRIAASFYPAYIMAKNVTKGVPGISLQCLAPALAGCLHDYALTTDDLKKLAEAQIFVANGAGMESFLDKIIAQYPHLKIIQLAEGIPLIKEAGNAGDNPHVWLGISNAIIQVENLGQAMEAFDPPRRELYAKNTADYVERLEALRQKMSSELAPYKGRVIITFHEAFPYFAREFDLKIAAVVEREPGSEPSARELANTIELIRKNNIPALFSEPQYPSTAAQIIARETGVKVYLLDPAVSGPDDDEAYIKIMENNLAVLKKAFANN